MKQKYFTIVELLVAMALTFVVIMALSTIYVRVSQFALEQSTSVSSYSNENSILDIFSNDLRQLYLPTLGVGVTTSSRMMSSVATATISSNSVNVTPKVPDGTDKTGWPYFAFTVTGGGNFSDIGATINDYSSIAYFCGPPLNSTSTAPADGLIDSNLLTLYRFVNQKPRTVDKFFDTTSFSGASSQIITNKAIYMAIVAHQGYVSAVGARNKRATRTAFDTNADLFDNSLDYSPDELDILLTMVPDSGYLEFNIIGGASASISFKAYQELGTDGTLVAADSITKLSSFTWDQEGFFANLTSPRQGVFYFRTSGILGDIKIWKVKASGASSILAGDTLATGTTSRRSLSLK